MERAEEREAENRERESREGKVYVREMYSERETEKERWRETWISSQWFVIDLLAN